MPSIKQIQSRILTKKKTLDTANLKMQKAEKSNDRIAKRKISQEKESLGRDIRKLERQLITEKQSLNVKKSNPYQFKKEAYGKEK
jgi:hypothetical protein